MVRILLKTKILFCFAPRQQIRHSISLQFGSIDTEMFDRRRNTTRTTMRRAGLSNQAAARAKGGGGHLPREAGTTQSVRRGSAIRWRRQTAVNSSARMCRPAPRWRRPRRRGGAQRQRQHRRSASSQLPSLLIFPLWKIPARVGGSELDLAKGENPRGYFGDAMGRMDGDGCGWWWARSGTCCCRGLVG
jgi:hypothetical protein